MLPDVEVKSFQLHLHTINRRNTDRLYLLMTKHPIVLGDNCSCYQEMQNVPQIMAAAADSCNHSLDG